MAIYLNLRRDAPIASVEFSPVPEGNYAFFHLSPGADAAQVAQLLTRPEIGQEVLARTRMDGHEVLITRGPKTQKELFQAFSNQGMELALPEEKKQFKPWKLRGYLSIVGQPLQLISGYLAKGGIDVATVGFAISNLMANGTNIVFGAEKMKDVHQLRYLKKQFNEKISAYLPEGAALPSVDDCRAELRAGDETQRSLGGKCYDFMKRNSVRVGEVGLRYIGATSLAFPIEKPVAPGSSQKSMAHWGRGLEQAAEGDFKGAYESVKNADAPTRRAGLLYLLGKTVALFSKVPDPYNPDPPGFLDKLREKYVFRLASVIEFGAAVQIAYDRISNPKRQMVLPKSAWLPESWRGATIKHDWLGFVGGVLFAVAQGIRFFAPFGTREVDMQELNAHITDGLAKVPQDKLPQLLADTAADLKMHFKDKAPEFGEIYRQLTNDLFRYHHIAVHAAGAGAPAIQAALEPLAPAVDAPPAKSFAHDGLRKSSPAVAAPLSHTQKAALPVGESALAAV